MNCTPHQILLGVPFVYEMGRGRISIHERNEKFVIFSWES